MASGFQPWRDSFCCLLAWQKDPCASDECLSDSFSPLSALKRREQSVRILFSASQR